MITLKTVSKIELEVMYLVTSGGHKQRNRRTTVWRVEGGCVREVLLYLLGGDEKQLLSPLLFPALFFLSYPLIFQNTAFSPSASPRSYLVLQQLCLRPRSRQTTKWAVIGQLQAHVMKPLDPHLCDLSPPLPQLHWSGLCLTPSIHPSLTSFLSSFKSVSDGSVSTWEPHHIASLSAVAVLSNLSYDPCTICLHAHGFPPETVRYSQEAFHVFYFPQMCFLSARLWIKQLFNSSSKWNHWLAGSVWTTLKETVWNLIF